MRPTEGLHVEWVDDEAVVLDPRSGEIHYLNSPAAKVYALIGEVGYDDATKMLRDEYGTVEGFEADLVSLVDDLVERGLLTREPDSETPGVG